MFALYIYSTFAEDDKSNQFLQNDGASQKLSRDEIMSLKAQGVSGKVRRFCASVNFIPTILDKIPWGSHAKTCNYQIFEHYLKRN